MSFDLYRNIMPEGQGNVIGQDLKIDILKNTVHFFRKKTIIVLLVIREEVEYNF